MDQTDVAVLRRPRRGRRPLLDFRSEIVFSGVLFILMVWMAFVALTLWH
jgi:hypothetical protein